MEIRYLSPDDDIYAVSNVYEQSWKYAYQNIIPQQYLDSIPAGRWAKGLENNRDSCLVAVEEGRIAGTSSIRGSRWEKYSDYGEIISIYFLPEYMGKGYGKLLLERAVEELHKRGFQKVLLWVLEENARARRFYDKCGFSPVGEVMADCIGGKELREVMYAREIE